MPSRFYAQEPCLSIIYGLTFPFSSKVFKSLENEFLRLDILALPQRF